MDRLQEEAKKEAALEARHKAIEEDELNKVSDTWFLKQLSSVFIVMDFKLSPVSAFLNKNWFKDQTNLPHYFLYFPKFLWAHVSTW